MEAAYLAVLVAAVLGIAAISLYVAYKLVAGPGVNKRRPGPRSQAMSTRGAKR
jgi:hypothetical protein